MKPLNTENTHTWQNKDPKAFEVLFLHYYPQVKNFINKLIQNDEDAEDLSQDIFTELWQSRTLLGEVDNLNAYLYRIAKNRAYRYMERNLLFKKYQEKWSLNEKSFQISSNQVEEDFRAQELELLVSIAVSKMPPQRQKIYKMSREQGMANEQIAIELGISKRTVENHLTQALSDIRKLIIIALILFY